jgi:valyl-tRNA synthetase
MGLHFMGDVPFRRVLLHGMVVDETGEKMSKVKANSIDPIDLIHGSVFENVVEKALPGAPVAEAFAKFKKSYPSVAQMGKGFPAYGADAVRLTLCSYSPQARRIALSPKRIEGYRHFCNKVYNAIRFALPHVERQALSGTPPEGATVLFNRWILSRLARAVEASSRGIEDFRLDEAANALYQFFWYEHCDWYLEATKTIFAHGSDAEQSETRATLAHVIEASLRALHPFMPFVTEELWQRVPRPPSRPISVALAPYPEPRDGRIDTDAEQQMSTLMAAIGAARTVRSEHGVHPSDRVPLRLRTSDGARRALLSSEQRLVRDLVGTDGDAVIEEAGGARPPGFVLSTAGDVEVLVDLRGLVEAAKESERIERGLKKLTKDIESLAKRLNNPSFVEKAPPEVVAEARAQHDALVREREKLAEARTLVEELTAPPKKEEPEQ